MLPAAPTLLAACSTPTPNPYLSGNYGPVSEEITAVDLRVAGELPRELIGRYLRNGPNPGASIDAASHHWFIGHGMVHGMRLNEGRAEWYRSRTVNPGAEGGPNTNVLGHAGKTLALVESGGAPFEMADDLSPIGAHDAFGGGYTAHPKLDPDTGELHALCYDWMNLQDHIRYVVIDAQGNMTKNMPVPMPGMIMVHDMSLTENYVVIFDLPVTLSFLAIGTGSGFPFRWDEDHEPRVGLLPRDGTAADIVWCPVSPQAVFHPMNAFEDPDGRVIIDLITYRTVFNEDVRGPFGDDPALLHRWTVNPATRTVSEEKMDDRMQEFPRCHPALNGKPYQYGYTVAVEGFDFPSLLKHDTRAGTATTFSLGAGNHFAEPLFVPRQDGSAEDDGYIMTFVFNKESNTSSFIVLDARDFSRPPLASVQLPTRVPYGFHGNWVPDIA